jgi:hypothetical protein
MTFIEIVGGPDRGYSVWVNTDAIASIEGGPAGRGSTLVLVGGIKYFVMETAFGAKAAVADASEGRTSVLARDPDKPAEPL